MKKSIIVVASLLVVGALFLAGCQSKGDGEANSEKVLRVGTVDWLRCGCRKSSGEKNQLQS